MGAPALDNTHKVRGGFDFDFDRMFGSVSTLPIEDDAGALQVGIWRATDRAYKNAVKQLIKVKGNREVKVEEDDHADDFSKEKPQNHLDPIVRVEVDRAVWRDRLRRLSALFKAHPRILNSSIALQGGTTTQYFVDTDGARLRQSRFFARLMIWGTVKADDGMDLELYDDVEASTAELAPHRAAAHREGQHAHLPAGGPPGRAGGGAVQRPSHHDQPRGGGVLPRIFGHRIEGHRNKDADEGHTFTKKVGQQVVPDFISVTDDPTRERFGVIPLNGHYTYDDEGVPAQKVTWWTTAS